jgi:hypothetical protein
VVDYIKQRVGVDVTDHYVVTYCILRKTMTWCRKLFFCGMEISIKNANILYKECAKGENEKVISHIMFRRRLIYELVFSVYRDGKIQK